MTPDDSHHRPRYHFTPPAHWINDPNGLVYYQGEYHLFYQYHPESSVWGPMHWGHAVSPDLLHWQHLPVALAPDEHGVIFSGSAVIDWDNTAGFGREAMVAVFTHHQDRQSQSLAYSTDRGRTWTKYAGNPVLLPPDGLRDFRDPKVFWYGERGPQESGAGHWVMALAADPEIRFYTSPDLIHWQASGGFGAGHGAHGGVWETPDLFALPVDGTGEQRWVLTVGVGSGAPAGGSGQQYFVGSFDGQTFTSENPPETVLWADYGADYYAAQSWSDAPGGRRLMIGWQSNWQYANQVPTTTWRGGFSLPRVLSLRQTEHGPRLFQQPVQEIAALRTTHTRWQDVDLDGANSMLANLRGMGLEIQAEFLLSADTPWFGVQVRVGRHEHTTVGYDVAAQRLFLDRGSAGESAFHPGFAARHTAPLAPVDGKIRLQIFLDRSCVEVFANDGAVTISDTIFPALESDGLALVSGGGATVLTRLDIYQMQPVMPLE